MEGCLCEDDDPFVTKFGAARETVTINASDSWEKLSYFIGGFGGRNGNDINGCEARTKPS
jgi:hypothetical protein